MNTDKTANGFIARQFIDQVLRDPTHPMYVAQDVELAKTLHISRLTVINIRRELSIECRKNRVLALFRGMDTGVFTINEIASKFCLKYQNVYQLIKKNGFKTRPDKRPIESMIEFQKKSKQTFWG